MSLAIILVVPQMGENIGAAARIMKNFGFSELRLVAPRDGWPNPMAVDMAVGASNIVEAAKVYDTLEEAVADLHYTTAVTARPRDMVKAVHTPREFGGVLAEKQGLSCGIIFGRERIGLTNEEVVLADSIVTIPTNPEFSSLNLAQAVAVLCYELSMYDTAPRAEPLIPAPKEELMAMLEHLEETLDANGAYAKVGNKRPKMVANLRNMFTRAGLTQQEVQSFRGVIRVLTGDKRQR